MDTPYYRSVEIRCPAKTMVGETSWSAGVNVQPILVIVHVFSYVLHLFFIVLEPFLVIVHDSPIVGTRMFAANIQHIRLTICQILLLHNQIRKIAVVTAVRRTR